MSATDKRRRERRKLWLPVMLSSDDGEQHLAIIHDVSENGVMAVTANIFSLGTALTLVYRVPPDETIDRKARGKVVRMARNDEDPDGLWPRKVGIALEDRQAILGALSAL